MQDKEIIWIDGYGSSRMVTRYTIDNLACKYCGSKNIVKYGTYNGVQRWWCKKCKRKFVDTNTLYKMKTPIDQIGGALSMYYRGMSLDDIGEHLEQQYGNRLTDAGIYNWVVRFSKDAVEEAKKQTPDVGDVWVADETVLKIGGRNIWFWDLICAKTRFLLASHISARRTTQDAKILAEEASKRAGKHPRFIVTDKLQAYLDAFEQVWGADATHLQSRGLSAPNLNTNLIERFHETLKQRTKVMRSFKNKKTAKLLLDGFLVHYNYFRPHEALNDRTPAEVAGIKFVYKDWQDVVRGEAKTQEREVGDDEPQPKIQQSRASPISTPYRVKHYRKPKRAKRRAYIEPSFREIRVVKGVR